MTRVRRPCACRAFLEADKEDPAEVAAVVAGHQRTPQHRDWWDEQSAIDEKVRIPVQIGPRASLRRIA